MMSVPFFVQGLGVVCILAGRRGVAIILWAASIIIMLALFKLHATDALPVSL
jgi:hypothetical protein